MDRGLDRRALLARAAAGAAGAALGVRPAWALGGGPRPIRRGEAQLFVDDALIDAQAGLQRTLHQPRKDGGGASPAIALEDEFGGDPATLEANGTIVYDPRLRRYVMFALGFCPSRRGPDRVRLYRFTSRNGLDWIKGDDRRPEWIRFELTARDGASASNIDLFSCWYDRRQRAYPYQGWLYFANWGPSREGIYHVRSRDGRRWQRVRRIATAGRRTFDHDGHELVGPSDVSLFTRDERRDRFLASLRFCSREPLLSGNQLRSRAYAFLDRIDQPVDLRALERPALVPPAADRGGDHPFDEYYGSTAWRYESLWLGGLKVWHGQGDYPHSAAGCAFLKLVVSRNGLRWRKLTYENEDGVPEVFLPNGAEGGNGGRNDGGFITEFSQGPLRLGRDLVFYYGASSYGKNQREDLRVTGGGIFRARLRRDGFVSVDAGQLTTPPLTLPGRGLEVNAVGPVRVEVLARGGRDLATARLRGDSVRHHVRFRGSSLGELAGQTARLRFAVGPGGSLYSFTVR